LVVGGIIYQTFNLAFQAYDLDMANPNPEIRAAAVANLGLIFWAAMLGTMNLVMLTIISVRLHFMYKIIKRWKVT
jgi:hypothetical protein